MPMRTSRTGPLKISAAEIATAASRASDPTATGVAPARRLGRLASAEAPARTPLRAGFTLIEILSVLLIMGLAMALVLPNLGARRTSALHNEAVRVAGQLELARQLAVVTGRPHRMWIDVETGVFRLEWFGKASEEESFEDTEPFDPYARRQPIDLSPPEDEFAYHPVEGRFGSDSRLPSDFFFEGLDTAEGWFDSNEVALVFQGDGTTDAAELVIADDAGNSVVLEVRPLLDTIRILHDDDV